MNYYYYKVKLICITVKTNPFKNKIKPKITVVSGRFFLFGRLQIRIIYINLDQG